jgi:UDP-N-acetylglucosamine 2-epimerase (non-hydrolysing)
LEKVTGKVMAIFGTRPEAIKLAPVIGELRSRNIPVVVVITAQHRQMIDQSLAVFGIRPDIDLDIMTAGQTLSDIVIRSTAGIAPVMESFDPDIVLVQGDTTSAAAMALAAANHKIKVGHVEAGLRTHDKNNPFPEEINRQIIGRIADLHFAPTAWARDNLLGEGVPENTVFVTGNTVVDAIRKMRPEEAGPDDKALLNLGFMDTKVVLVTTHRRENFGQPLRNICAAIKQLAAENQDAQFIVPVHPNPNVKPVVEGALAGVAGVKLVSPLSYTDLLWLPSRC